MVAAEAEQPSHEPDLRAAAGSWVAVPALAQGPGPGGSVRDE